MKKTRKKKEAKAPETKNVDDEKRLSYSEKLFENRKAVMASLGIKEDFMADEINKELINKEIR
jgi:hypothetical protein